MGAADLCKDSSNRVPCKVHLTYIWAREAIPSRVIVLDITAPFGFSLPDHFSDHYKMATGSVLGTRLAVVVLCVACCSLNICFSAYWTIPSLSEGLSQH